MTTKTTEVKYETRSVKAIRGMEPRTIAKLEKEGWEFVSQTQGTVRSELNFRRTKPQIPWKLISIVGGILALLIIVIVIVSTLGGGDNSSKAAEPVPTQTPTEVVATKAIAPSAAPSADPEIAAPVVTNITVDELLDKLNSAKLGGIKTGDQFQLTGELVMSDLWTTGATGEFTVLLKAHGGADDLMVFVDKSDASEWHDGTKVQMLVESGEATINDETTDGWLRAVSVKTIL